MTEAEILALYREQPHLVFLLLILYWSDLEGNHMSEDELEALAISRGGTVTRMVGQVTPMANSGLPPEISEKDFMARVISYAESRSWRVYHTYRSDRSEPGFPDFVLVRNKVIFAELKAETGKMTNHQRHWYADLLAAGADVYLWRPSDFDTILKILA